jgi:hypothetical protein
MGMGCAQAISAAWLTTKMQDYKRPVALAAYVMSIQLANFPGNQLFRAQGEISLTRSGPESSSDMFRRPSIHSWIEHRCWVRHRRSSCDPCLEVALQVV